MLHVAQLAVHLHAMREVLGSTLSWGANFFLNHQLDCALKRSLVYVVGSEYFLYSLVTFEKIYHHVKILLSFFSHPLPLYNLILLPGLKILNIFY